MSNSFTYFEESNKEIDPKFYDDKNGFPEGEEFHTELLAYYKESEINNDSDPEFYPTRLEESKTPTEAFQEVVNGHNVTQEHINAHDRNYSYTIDAILTKAHLAYEKREREIEAKTKGSRPI